MSVMIYSVITVPTKYLQTWHHTDKLVSVSYPKTCGNKKDRGFFLLNINATSGNYIEESIMKEKLSNHVSRFRDSANFL